mmetsp:Transcript_21592/g.43782  ORF Transcript_21592/g.43782 Transcript_21592/m.43782 type:complete len:203 (+) Transcript_21592:72-680(+)
MGRHTGLTTNPIMASTGFHSSHSTKGRCYRRSRTMGIPSPAISTGLASRPRTSHSWQTIAGVRLSRRQLVARGGDCRLTRRQSSFGMQLFGICTSKAVGERRSLLLCRMTRGTWRSPQRLSLPTTAQGRTGSSLRQSRARALVLAWRSFLFWWSSSKYRGRRKRKRRWMRLGRRVLRSCSSASTYCPNMWMRTNLPTRCGGL